MVVLAARDEAHLRGLEVALRNTGVGCTLVVESDGPYAGQATAVGCELVRDRDPCRRVLSSLPLYGRDVVRVTRQTSPPLELPKALLLPVRRSPPLMIVEED